MFTDAELSLYLDESLEAETMARIERAARDEPSLQARLAEAVGRRDSGVHTLGAIWRRHRLSCPTREQWGNYLLGTLDANEAGFYEFHVRAGGCRYCQANLEDLRSLQARSPTNADVRRRKFFQSSAGKLPKSSP